MGNLSTKKIIVAIDGSETAKDALRFALVMAADLGCTVTAVTAIQTQLPGYRAGYFSFVDRHILEELRQFAAGVIQEAEQTAIASGVPVEPKTLEGEKEIFEQLVDFIAGTPDAGFVVMGSFGHGIRERHLLGSTSQRVILEIARRQMKTPVVVVP